MIKGKKILIVDDDVAYQNEIASYLAQQGMFVFPRTNKTQFIQSLNDDRPDIVLIDKNLDGEDGFDLIHEVRSHSSLHTIPIIVATGDASLVNKQQAITLGADDILAKPLTLAELELRIVANLRRSKSYHLNESILKFNEIEVNLRTHEVKISDVSLNLTRTEYKIFLELVSKRGVIVNRDQIAQRFLSIRNSNERTLDVHINSLRRKLGDFSSCVKTVRGRGYMFHYDV